MKKHINLSSDIRRIRIVVFSTLIFVLKIHMAFGQNTIPCDQTYFNDSLLQKLTGVWTASGEVHGEKVYYQFKNEWILNHQFLDMSFQDKADNPVYTAKVLFGYDCIKNKYVVHWNDNFGGRFSETVGYGDKKDQSIEMLFDYPEGQLKNTFTYNKKEDSWNSHTVIKVNEQWIPFGDIYLTHSK